MYKRMDYSCLNKYAAQVMTRRKNLSRQIERNKEEIIKLDQILRKDEECINILRYLHQCIFNAYMEGKKEIFVPLSSCDFNIFETDVKKRKNILKNIEQLLKDGGIVGANVEYLEEFEERTKKTMMLSMGHDVIISFTLPVIKK